MGVYNITWVHWFFITFAATHFTIIAVTLYLHRCQSHRALDLHPLLCHVFRLWLWLTTGMNTRDWVAVHRKHHAYVETKEDPHSPVVHGVWTVLFNGVGLYRRAAADKSIIEKYGAGTPNDWLENHLYSSKNFGVVLMFLFDVVLFGWGKGSLMWVVQMLWIPLLAAGVINGVGHHVGYRNFQPSDESKNIVPWGILIGGEELHNNHHAFPRSAKFSSRAFEFDLGYQYIKLLTFLKLANVRYVMPDLNHDTFEGIKGILNARMGILSKLHKEVIRSVFDTNVGGKVRLKGVSVARILSRPPSLLGEKEKQSLKLALSLDTQLEKCYELQVKLHKIFYENRGQDLMQQLRDWCQEAHAAHQKSLSDFALWLEERFLVASEV